MIGKPDPDAVLILDLPLPRNAAGKVLKMQLRALCRFEAKPARNTCLENWPSLALTLGDPAKMVQTYLLLAAASKGSLAHNCESRSTPCVFNTREEVIQCRIATRCNSRVAKSGRVPDWFRQFCDFTP